MFKKLFFALLLVIQGNNLSAFSEIEQDATYRIYQERGYRLYRVYKDQQHVGTMVGRAWGIIDFYDSDDNMLCYNIGDELFDLQGNILEISRFGSNPTGSYSIKWDWGTRILIQREKCIFYMEQEGENWIFREVTSREVFAIGQQVCEDGWLYEKCHNDYSIKILNAPLLETCDISLVDIMWCMMKHIQKHLESPDSEPFIPNYPTLPKPWYCIFGLCN